MPDEGIVTASTTSQESPTAAPVNTEAAAPQTLLSDGQVGTPIAETTQPEAPAKLDYAKLHETDPEFKQFVEGRAGQIAQKQAEKARRESEREAQKARLTRAAEEPVEALEYAQEQLSSIQRWDTVKATIEATARENPQWAADYSQMVAENQAEADKIYATDPEAYEKWVDQKIYDARIQREVEKRIKNDMPTLVAARLTEELNKRALGEPVFPTGNGGAARFTLAQIERMDSATFKANEEAINRQFGYKK